MFNDGAFGGAPKRYYLLFKYLCRKFPGKFYLILNNHLLFQLTSIFPDLDLTYIRVVDLNTLSLEKYSRTAKKKIFSIPDEKHSLDAEELDALYSFPRKIYWYIKNYLQQKKLFFKIEKLRIENDIQVFYGVFSGVLPLVFYISEKQKRASVIFSNMDSWFSNVHGNMKKLWYRKYYSFNYALENADVVDFLSPYIQDGVKKRNVNVKKDTSFVSPCSFTDFSKCISGNKDSFEVAFAARLEPDKNPIMFLEAALIVNKKYPEIKFHILGEGSLANEVSGFIRQNSLEKNVNFSFHKDPPQIFSCSSVFVSLQTGTNYPSQSVLEAMACGNMIIASNSGDTELFINNNNGCLIQLNTTQLVSAIEEAYLYRDKTLAKGKYAARFVSENHTIEKFSDYFLELLQMAYNKNFSPVAHKL